MTRSFASFACSAIACMTIAGRIWGAVPSQVNFQGFVADDLGEPVTTTADITVNIYQDFLAVTPVFTETHAAVPISGGVFTVTIGEVESLPLSVFNPLSVTPPQLSVEVDIGGEIITTPRTDLLSVPYARVTERIDGDLRSAPSVLIADDASPADGVDTELRMSDLSVALALDRGAGDSVRATLDAEALTFANTLKDARLQIGAVSIQLGDPPPPALVPADPQPFIAITDDVFGQIFASMHSAGNLTLSEEPSGKLSDLLPAEARLECEPCGTATLVEPAKVRLVDGLDTATIELQDKIAKFTPPSDAGGLELGPMTAFDNPTLLAIAKTTPVLLDTGAYLDLTGDLSGRTARLTGERLSLNDNTNGDVLELTDEDIALTNAAHDSVRIRGSEGVTVISGLGLTTAAYAANGVQLTGPGLSQYLATADVTLYIAENGNDAMRLRNELFGGSLVCYDGAGGGDSALFDHTGVTLYSGGLESSRFSTTSVSFAVPVTHGEACTFEGSTDCRSSSSYDPNNDATPDVTITASPSPALTLAAGTDLKCDGPATFAAPVQVNSDLTVDGALTVTGPKAFAQDHPSDPTRQIIYVALEGGEAGTYTRGSARLDRGEARIDLPEHFALVTAPEGLTAQITPRGPVHAMLWVQSVTPGHLIVRSSSSQDVNVPFDFVVNGVRAGFEDHQPVQTRKELASRN